MADEKLPPFQIRNLESSNKHSSGQDALVRISGPTYDRTISDNPAATLRYMDEDNDTIIVSCTADSITYHLILTNVNHSSDPLMN